jgi:hypothetical protein
MHSLSLSAAVRNWANTLTFFNDSLSRVVGKCEISRIFLNFYENSRHLSIVAKFSRKSFKHLCFREHFQMANMFLFHEHCRYFCYNFAGNFLEIGKMDFCSTLNASFFRIFKRNHIIKYVLLKFLTYPILVRTVSMKIRPVGSSARPFRPWLTSIREQTRTLNT